MTRDKRAAASNGNLLGLINEATPVGGILNRGSKHGRIEVWGISNRDQSAAASHGRILEVRWVYQ